MPGCKFIGKNIVYDRHPVGERNYCVDLLKVYKIQEEIITEVYKACQRNGVFLEGTLLKPSMTVQGAECEKKVLFDKVLGRFDGAARTERFVS